jgi:hypothetical protein
MFDSVLQCADDVGGAEALMQSAHSDDDWQRLERAAVLAMGTAGRTEALVVIQAVALLRRSGASAALAALDAAPRWDGTGDAPLSRVLTVALLVGMGWEDLAAMLGR